MEGFLKIWDYSILGKIGVISGLISLVITVFLGLPQLIKVIREKQTKNVNFVSFWIFNIGLLLWIVYATLLPGSLLPVVIANLLSVIIYCVMIFFLYFYKSWKTNASKMLGMINISIVLIIMCLISSILTIIWLIDQTRTIDEHILITINKPWMQILLSSIIPAFTCLSFIPQLISSFKRKSFAGVSVVFSFILMLNNITWWLYWFTVAKYYDPAFPISFILTLSWQALSVIIYLIQLTAVLVFNFKEKNIKKQEDKI
ncbi:SemiSWEET family transporter [Mycoplasma phocimorsus]|uniref:SemiSWEET family transporter n=1 Tax=Mycoplasma phocimorsus TaxID=3045839 RepID=UPI0024BF5927|nr:SemiSWEET family transporter [Mycoplasma phocimorsus]MDJ1648059.1 SemiSWEET family transporter [Mycoplasma phocimorsus]